jgi:hypothetical protein
MRRIDKQARSRKGSNIIKSNIINSVNQQPAKVNKGEWKNKKYLNWPGKIPKLQELRKLKKFPLKSGMRHE